MINLAVKVLPKSSTNAIIGWVDDAKTELSLKVQAPPADGSANQAVIKLFAQELRIAKSKLEIKRGSTSRHKLLEIDIAPNRFEDWLKSKQL